MNKEIIGQYISKANPWWDEKEKFELGIEYKERKIYSEIAKFFPTKQIISLTGLRRVGKTTLMMKLIKESLENNFNKLNILYFSFDEFSDLRILGLFEIYENLISKIDKSKRYLICLDEIQKLKNWSEQLKVAYDLYSNIKFIISGSESLFIRKKSKESLAGRIYEFKINPLSFKEFLEFRNIKINNFFIQKEKIIENFKQFLISGGFPELINSKEDEARKYINEGVVDKIIYKDLPDVFEVKNSTLMKSIFNVIYNDPGQIIEIQELSKELGVSRQLVSNYLEYLEQAFLIKKNPLTAIEIKSGEIKDRNLKSLKIFIYKFNPKNTLILSYDIEKEINKIKVIPFYKYLLGKN